MAEDSSAGYRGWGTASSTTRHASTTLSGGKSGAMSDGGTSTTVGAGGYHSPGSPTNLTTSDQNSGDPLLRANRSTMDSDTMGALGPMAAAGRNNNSNGNGTGNGVNRGPSNASSHYSAGDHSNISSDEPVPMSNPQDYYGDHAGMYGGHNGSGPYGGDASGYGGAAGQQQPVIRDVSARRNTRIENPGVRAQPGNAGIAQNF
ncbi:hypothetical protein K402DRAFT_323387 [Aulographum hederae CBS 113979]|uniref:Uncharacterized protein n=1 Tax=Aulographum hederae CBS 113979 TaxID=1176131 RepID=A0A6G1HDA4_9PEZI|nr:hypothetical protein K402DRAFT_323387 [Aulographum hederae CBS 113979]